MDKRFIWLNEKKCINEFEIGYMINPSLHINKALRDQIEKFMNTTFGELTLSFIKATFPKDNTSVLELIIFHDTRA